MSGIKEKRRSRTLTQENNSRVFLQINQPSQTFHEKQKGTNKGSNYQVGGSTSEEDTKIFIGTAVVVNAVVLGVAVYLFTSKFTCEANASRVPPYEPAIMNVTSITEYDKISLQSFVCGVPEVQPNIVSYRVAGGSEAIPHSWPYTVAFGTIERISETTTRARKICGATLISPRHALTAAHCFNDDWNGRIQYFIFAKAHDLSTFQGSKLLQVKVVRFHPKTNAFSSNPNPLEYDFALLTLLREFAISAEIKIACLPLPRKVVEEEAECWATGWGDTKGTGGDDLLKQIEIEVMSQKTCRNQLSLPIQMESTFCGKADIKQGVCSGDSGGPLLCKWFGKWELYGVASFAFYPCNSNPASAWGTVSYQLQWICCYMPVIPGCATINCTEKI